MEPCEIMNWHASARSKHVRGAAVKQTERKASSKRGAVKVVLAGYF